MPESRVPADGEKKPRRRPHTLDPSLLAHPERRDKPLNAVYGEPPTTVEGWRALSAEEQQEWIDSGWHPPADGEQPDG